MLVDSTNRSPSSERAAVVLLALALVGVFGGCDDQPAPPPVHGKADLATTDKEQAGGEMPAGQSRHKGTPGGQRAKPDKSQAGSRIGEIPKDAWPEVFFDEPLNVASEGAVVDRESHSNKRQLSASGSAEPQAAVGSSAATSAPGASDWGLLISGEDLADEVKTIKASLADKLQSIGKYNGNYKDVRYDAATLAAIAAIAIDHPDAPSWKRNARYVRDVAADLVRSAAGLGEKSYKPSRAAYDKLDALLAGSIPPGLEETSDTAPISELVTRVPLMYRMERAFNWMKLTINTDGLFKKESSKVAHEGAMLATLARVIAAAGYPDADIDEYIDFSRNLSESGLKAAEAARDGNYPAYTAALDLGGKACTECHSNFKNN